MDKVVASAADAVADVFEGATLAITGFGRFHQFPRSLTAALADQGTKDLRVVCLVLDPSNGNRGGFGLVGNGQVSRLISVFPSRAGEHSVIDEQVEAGNLEIEMTSMGVLVERLRAGGTNIPAFYFPTGVGTEIAKNKEVREFNGRSYVLEEGLHLDFAFIQAWRADRSGNVQFRGSSQNINPTVAMGAKVAIVEAQEIVEVGEISPEDVDLPGIYIDRVASTTVHVDVKPPMIQRRAAETNREYLGKPALSRAEMAQWVAEILPEPGYVNLGAGLPTLVSNYIADRDIVMHSENGVMGYGGVIALASGGHVEGVDPDIYNASGNYVSLKPGASFFNTLGAFEMARSGKLHAVVLGAFQVDEQATLANWKSPQMTSGGIGGAMDLAAADTELIIIMEHQARGDQAKLVKACTYPVTAHNCVDVVVTDLAIFRRHEDRFVLERVAPGFSAAEIVELTEMDFDIAPALQ